MCLNLKQKYFPETNWIAHFLKLIIVLLFDRIDFQDPACPYSDENQDAIFDDSDFMDEIKRFGRFK